MFDFLNREQEPQEKRDKEEEIAPPDPVQRAAQSEYLQGVRQSSKPTPEKEEKKGFWGTIGGWASKAGDAVASGAKWAGNKATQAWDATKEVAGEAWEGTKAAWKTTKKVAGDVWDVASSTSLGYADGKVKGETDIGELADLGLGLDGLDFDNELEGANQIGVEIDTKTGVVTLTSAMLALDSMNMGGLSTGPAKLLGVTIVLSNPSGKYPRLSDQDLDVKILVDEITAESLTYETPQGPLSARSVRVCGVSIDARNPSGGVPLLDGVQDNLEGEFFVDSVDFDGVSGAGVEGESVSANGLRGAASTEDQTAWAEVDALRGAGLKSGDNKVEQANIEGIRADVATAGEAPHVAASVAHADAKGVHTAAGGAESLKVDGAAARLDLATQQASAEVKSVEANGLDAAGVQADHLAAEELSAHGSMDGEQLGMSLGEAKAEGLAVGDTQVAAAHVRGVKAERDGDVASAALEHASVRDLKSGDAKAEHAALSGVSANGARTDAGWRANAAVQSGSARKVSAGGAHALEVDLDGVKAEAEKAGEVTSGSVEADRIRGKGVGAGDVSVGQVDAKGLGLKGGVGPDGAHAEAKLRSLDAAVVDVGANQAESVSVTGLSARGTQNGDAAHAEVEAERLALRKLAGEDFDADSFDAQGVRVAGGRDGAGVSGSASVEQASARNLHGLGASLDAVELEKVQADAAQRDGKTVAEAKVGGVSATGFERGDVKARGITGKNLGVQLAEGRTQAAAEDLSLNQVEALGVTAERARIQGANAVIESGANPKNAAGVDRLDVTNIGGEHGSAKSLTGQGMAVNWDKESMATQAKSLDAHGLKAPGFGAERLSGQGASSYHKGTHNEFGLDAGHAEGAHFEGGRWAGQVKRADLKGAAATIDAGAVESIRADQVNAQGIGFDVQARQANDAKSTGGGYVSPSQLVRGVAPLVDEVDLDANVPMTAGDIGPATVEKGTNLGVSVRARDNALVPGQTKAMLDKPLDGPAWTTLKGVKLEEAKARKLNTRSGSRTRYRAPTPVAGEGKLTARVGGFFDQNVTGKANEALGRDGKTMPLSLTELGDAVADRMEQPAAPKAKPAAEGGVADRFDMKNMSLDGRVKLSGGEANLGDRQHVQVRDGKKPGDNEINVRARGGEDIVLEMVRLLTGSLRLQVADKQVKGEQAELSSSKLVVSQSDQGTSSFSGSVGAMKATKLAFE